MHYWRYKANFEAILERPIQIIRVGNVIRDCNGDLVTTKCANRKCVDSSFVVDCNALWEAMEDLGFWDARFEGDAKEVVDAVKKEDSDESWFG